MTDVIKSDFELQTEAKGFAVDIIDEIRDNMSDDETLDDYRDEISDKAWETADGSQHVIYTYRALQICVNCDTSNGEAFIDEMGGRQQGETIEETACKIAFGELHARIMEEIETIIEESEV